MGDNTDRMAQALLEQSGRERMFINLSKLRFDPCRACAEKNLRQVDDDLKPYLEPIRGAEALVFSTPIHHETMTTVMSSLVS